MALNGLDAPALQAAFDYASTEAGWFLTKYASRDDVELLGKGGSSVREMRELAQQEPDDSPLYGFIRYRRRNILIKLVPDGTSRVLKARSQVHFQYIIERFSPCDVTVSLTSSRELTDAALTAACSTHTATASISSSSSSIRQRRLTNIAEASEDGTASDVTRQQIEVKQDVKGSGSQGISVVVTTHDPGTTTEDGIRAPIEVEISRPEPIKLEEEIIIHPPPFDPNDMNMDMNKALPGWDSKEALRRKSTSSAPRPTENDMFLEFMKPKVKLGPRPSSDWNKRPSTASGSSKAFSGLPSSVSRPTASLPKSIQMPSTRARSVRKMSTESSASGPPIVIPPTPPLPLGARSPASFSPSLLSPTQSYASMKPSMTRQSSSPATPTITPEKARLMKALELRKKAMSAIVSEAQVQAKVEKEEELEEVEEEEEEETPMTPATPKQMTWSTPATTMIPKATELSHSDSDTMHVPEVAPILARNIPELDPEPKRETAREIMIPPRPSEGTGQRDRVPDRPEQEQGQQQVPAGSGSDSGASEKLGQGPGEVDPPLAPLAATAAIDEIVIVPESSPPTFPATVTALIDGRVSNTTSPLTREEDKPIAIMSMAEVESSTTIIPVVITPNHAATPSTSTQDSTRSYSDDLDKDSVSSFNPSEVAEDIRTNNGTPDIDEAMSKDHDDLNAPSSTTPREQGKKEISSAPQSIAPESQSDATEKQSLRDGDMTNDYDNDTTLMPQLILPKPRQVSSPLPSPGLPQPQQPISPPIQRVTKTHNRLPSTEVPVLETARSVSAPFPSKSPTTSTMPAVLAAPRKVNVAAGSVTQRIRQLEMLARNKTPAETLLTPPRSRPSSPVPNSPLLRTASLKVNSSNSPSSSPLVSSPEATLPSKIDSPFLSTYNLDDQKLSSPSTLRSQHSTPNLLRSPPQSPRERVRKFSVGDKLSTPTERGRKSSLNESMTNFSTQKPSLISMFQPSRPKSKSPPATVTPLAPPAVPTSTPATVPAPASAEDKKSRMPPILRKMSSMSKKSASPSSTALEPEKTTIMTAWVNVQLPETMLWKRRWLKVESDGWIYLAITEDETASTTRKWNVPQEARNVVIPDADEQELPHSVHLMLKEGGTLQCACQNIPEQKEIFNTVKGLFMLNMQ